MNKIPGIVAATALLAVPATGQTAPAAQALPSDQNGVRHQLDIGAENAPLTTDQRTALDAAVRAHNYSAEKKTLDAAIAEHPDSWQLLAMKGRIAFLEHQPVDAVEALEQTNRLKPLAESDQLTLALAYEFSGKLEQARARLAELAIASPKDARYAYLLARVERPLLRPADAERHYREALRLDPNLVRAWDDLAELYESTGHPDEARKAYESGVAANRKTGQRTEWPPLRMAVFLLSHDELNDAEKLLLEALQYNPRSALVHFQLGELRRKQGQADAAFAEFKEAVVDDPKLDVAWFAVGRELQQRGETEQAKRAFEIFRQLQAKQQTPAK